VLVGSVVLYSYALPHVYGVLPDGLTPEQAAMRATRQNLEQRLAKTKRAIEFKDHLVEAVVARRCALPEAADLLLQVERSMPAHRLRYLHWVYAGLDDRQCIAAAFAYYMFAHLSHDRPLARRMVREMRAAYRQSFGMPLPLPRCGTSPPFIAELLKG
jgi:hypothetical protein